MPLRMYASTLKLHVYGQQCRTLWSRISASQLSKTRQSCNNPIGISLPINWNQAMMDPYRLGSCIATASLRKGEKFCSRSPFIFHTWTGKPQQKFMHVHQPCQAFPIELSIHASSIVLEHPRRIMGSVGCSHPIYDRGNGLNNPRYTIDTPTPLLSCENVLRVAQPR